MCSDPRESKPFGIETRRAGARSAFQVLNVFPGEFGEPGVQLAFYTLLRTAFTYAERIGPITHDRQSLVLVERLAPALITLLNPSKPKVQ